MLRELLSLAVAAVAGPVPAHTSATSVSFVSSQTAFVLGTAPCTRRPCTVVLETVDRGTSWVGLAAPREPVSYVNGTGLWGLRFADALHGYAYGKGLWATSDGAQSWRRIPGPARFVFTLAVTRRRLIAIASNCGGNESCAPSARLFERPLAGGRWRKVVGSKAGFGGSIALHGRIVWALVGTRLLVSTDAGASFHARRYPCSGAFFGGELSDDGPHTYLLCSGQGFTGHTLKYVYRTPGPHSRWRLVGRPPSPGDGGELWAASERAIVIASSSAASWLYRSTDRGRHWRTALFKGDGGAGWGDESFTSAIDGAVIHGPAHIDGGSSNFPGQLLLTDDGGRTWHVASF
jgi:hypothetical protein